MRHSLVLAVAVAALALVPARATFIPTKNATEIVAAFNTTKQAILDQVDLKLNSATVNPAAARFTGTVTCYVDDATGDVAGLQLESVAPLCSTAGTPRSFAVPADGYIAGVKVAVDKETGGVGELVFVVKTNSTLVPTNVFSCGKKGGLTVSVMPKLSALASAGGLCKSSATQGRRLNQANNLLDPASLHWNVTTVTAPAVVRPTGQTAFTTPGTYTFVVPSNVGSIAVVAVGGGGGSAGYVGGNGPGSSGGGGGALAYKNAWPVASGETVTVTVGAGGTMGAAAGGPGNRGGASTVSAGSNTLTAGGGAGGVSGSLVRTAGGVPSGYFDGGGSGGQGGPGGPNNGNDGSPGAGGGAGGYSGNGGDGGQSGTCPGGDCPGSAGTAGSGGGGGGGGGGNGFYEYSAGGGGVGVLGQGSNGAGGACSGTAGACATAPNGCSNCVRPNPGLGGSSGSAGVGTTLPPLGGTYGGGAGGAGGNGNVNVFTGYNGASGAVRIIWGPNRAFPTQNTADM